MRKLTALSTASAAAGGVALAAGVVTPVGVIALAAATGIGAVGAAGSLYLIARGIVKSTARAFPKVLKGKSDRAEHANHLLELALSWSPDANDAIALLNAMDVTKKMPLEAMKKDRKLALAYIMKKMRS